MKIKHIIYLVLISLLLAVITTYIVIPNRLMLFSPVINGFMPFFIGICIAAWIFFYVLIVQDIEAYRKSERYVVHGVIFIGCIASITLTIRTMQLTTNLFSRMPFSMWIGALLGMIVLHTLLGVKSTKLIE